MKVLTVLIYMFNVKERLKPNGNSKDEDGAMANGCEHSGTL